MEIHGVFKPDYADLVEIYDLKKLLKNKNIFNVDNNQSGKKRNFVKGGDQIVVLPETDRYCLSIRPGGTCNHENIRSLQEVVLLQSRGCRGKPRTIF